MTEKQADRLISAIGFGIAAFVLVYFLTHLHHDVHANVFVYTYNTVTGGLQEACEGIKCFKVPPAE